MNKFIAALTAFILIFNFPIIANASGTNPSDIINSYENSETTDLGNGLIIKYKTTEITSNARATVQKAVKTADCEFEGKIIATLKLTATFSYTGSSATCTSASVSSITYDGWICSDKKVTRSGNSAIATATVSKGSHKFNIKVTMSCSPSGSIS